MNRVIKILMFVMCFLHIKVEAQNLVPNYSFENYLECPDTSFLQFYTLFDSTWMQFNSADPYNICSSSNYYSIPENRFGSQNTYSGNGYIGLGGYCFTIFCREYIEIKLTSPLLSGQTYHIQFYLSLADTSQYAIENIGALFTDTLFDPYPAPSYNWQTGVPQVENSPGNILNDKANWVPISGSFIANGSEQYMTIGNFRNDAQTVVQFLGNNGDPTTRIAYYYIDDVYVGSTPPVNVHENAKIKFDYKLYPNPNNGSFSVEYAIEENDQADLCIYSVEGRKIACYKLNANDKKILIQENLFSNGMYFYQIHLNGKIAMQDKLIIIR